MKRIASLFCTVLILLSICTIPASAHEECSFSKNHVPYKVTFPTALMSTMPLLQQSTLSWQAISSPKLSFPTSTWKTALLNGQCLFRTPFCGRWWTAQGRGYDT